MLLDILKLNFKTRGFAKFGFSYYVEATRKSGDAQTSVGNSVLQALMLVYVVCKHNGLTLRDFLDRSSLMVLGDDSLMCLPGHWTEGLDFRAELLQLGMSFKPKVHLGADARHRVTFCSGRFYPVSPLSLSAAGAGSSGSPPTFYKWGPDLAKFVAKFGYYCNPAPNFDAAVYVRGDCIGREFVVSGIPFMEDLVAATLRVVGREGPARLPDHYQIKGSRLCVANSETWALITEVYGLTRDHLVRYRDMLDMVGSLPTSVNFMPLRDAMVLSGIIEDDIVSAGFTHGVEKLTFDCGPSPVESKTAAPNPQLENYYAILDAEMDTAMVVADQQHNQRVTGLPAKPRAIEAILADGFLPSCTVLGTQMSGAEWTVVRRR